MGMKKPARDVAGAGCGTRHTLETQKRRQGSDARALVVRLFHDTRMTLGRRRDPFDRRESADKRNFRLQPVAGGCFHAFLDMHDQRTDLSGGGGPAVDDDVGMLARDLGVAHGKAFQAGFVDQPAGSIFKKIEPAEGSASSGG